MTNNNNNNKNNDNENIFIQLNKLEKFFIT
jgi:hypothetical protein